MTGAWSFSGRHVAHRLLANVWTLRSITNRSPHPDDPRRDPYHGQVRRIEQRRLGRPAPAVRADTGRTAVPDPPDPRRELRRPRGGGCASSDDYTIDAVGRDQSARIHSPLDRLRPKPRSKPAEPTTPTSPAAGTSGSPSPRCGGQRRSERGSPSRCRPQRASVSPQRRSAGTPGSRADPAARPPAAQPPRFATFASASKSHNQRVCNRLQDSVDRWRKIPR